MCPATGVNRCDSCRDSPFRSYSDPHTTLPAATPEVCAVHVQAALSATAPPDVVIALAGEHIAVAPATALPPGAVVLATRADLARLVDELDTGPVDAAHQAAAVVTDWAAIHHIAA